MLAVVVMARDEADVLEKCLTSVTGLGELHVSVDSATTDDSAAVAARLGAKVYSHRGLPTVPTAETAPAAEALNSYSRMRNDVLAQVEAQSRADWLMWLDADETLFAGGDVLLAALPQMNPEIQAVAVQMRLWGGGQIASVMRNSKVIRRGVRFTRRRHEHIVFNGMQALCDPCILDHHPEKRSRATNDALKLQRDAYLADWQEFQDGRSAFYFADWWWVHNEPEEALVWCERVLALGPDKCPSGQRNQAARYGGRMAEVLGYHAKARELYWQALESDWQDAESAYHIGALAVQAGKFDEGEHWFNTCLQHPDRPQSIMQQDVDATRAMPYYGLACIARVRGNREQAYELLDQAERAAACHHPQFADLRRKLDED
jgi:glycosyltransferase involved in cell wall biosynthesis